MRITVPTNTLPVANNQAFNFKSLVRWLINVDRRFNSSAAGIRASVRIDQEIEKLPDPVSEPGPETNEPAPDWYLDLRVEDYRLLQVAVAAPESMEEGQPGYPVFPGRLLLPWIDAIDQATEIPD